MAGEITIGVLGAGKMGLIHWESIAATPGLSLAAASSRSKERLAAVRQKFHITQYQSHEKLLANPLIQQVVIATTTNEHKKWVIKALEAGKQLIIEKPVALSHQEAVAIFKAAMTDATMPVEPEEVLKVMRLMDAVRQAASSGRSVSLA